MTDVTPSGATRRDLFKLSAFGLGAGAGAALFPGLASAAPGDDLPIPNTGLSYFLKLGSIKGDSAFRGYENQIPVLSWDWGVSVPSSTTTGGAGTGKPKPRPFKFLAATGRHTPKTFEALVKGTTLATVDFTVQPVENFANYFLTFGGVNVTDYENFPSAQDGQPLDIIQLVYRRLTIKVIPQAPSGAPGTPIAFSWDFAKAASF